MTDSTNVLVCQNSFLKCTVTQKGYGFLLYSKGVCFVSYNTVVNDSTGEYTEKKSRFIAVLHHIETEEQAAEFLSDIKTKYWDARHNVYAYVLRDGTVKFSDDGEPHGTAAKPVLDVIVGNNLKNVIITVTRYFGGVLLGTGGLVRAYSAAAVDAVNNAVINTVCLCAEFEIECNYNQFDSVKNYITKQVCLMLNTDYTENIVTCGYLPDENFDNFKNELTEIFAGNIKIIKKREIYYPL